MATALFPGSFDPFHLGHLAVVEWAADTYDEVVVAVLGNPEKQEAMFDPEERVRLAALATAHFGNVRCRTFQGLTSTLASEEQVDAIVRSAHKEVDVERTLAVVNRFMSGGIPTRFAPASPESQHVSSTAVRSLLASGDLDAARDLVPPAMRAKLTVPPGAGAPQPGSTARRSASARLGPLAMGRRVRPARLAVVQEEPVAPDRDDTLDQVLQLTERAAAEGAHVVVFPEAFIPGYPDWVWTTQPAGAEAQALAGALFDNAVVVGSAFTQVLGIAARRFDVYLSVGANERREAGSTLYSSQLLFDPDGALLSVHRRLAPIGGEGLVWGRGDATGLEVAETPFGRIGTLTGAGHLPLARAALYARGVDILLLPSWDDGAVWPSTVRHVANEGSVFAVGSNRRNALVAGPNGSVVAGAQGAAGGAMVMVEVDANQARQERHRLDPDGLAHRPELAGWRRDPAPGPGRAAGGADGGGWDVAGVPRSSA